MSILLGWECYSAQILKNPKLNKMSQRSPFFPTRMLTPGTSASPPISCLWTWWLA